MRFNFIICFLKIPFYIVRNIYSFRSPFNVYRHQFTTGLLKCSEASDVTALMYSSWIFQRRHNNGIVIFLKCHRATARFTCLSRQEASVVKRELTWPTARHLEKPKEGERKKTRRRLSEYLHGRRDRALFAGSRNAVLRGQRFLPVSH